MSGAVLPHMLSAGCGHIINISSDAARTIFPALAVYNASKAFVSTFSKALRLRAVGTLKKLGLGPHLQIGLALRLFSLHLRVCGCLVPQGFAC